MEQILANGVYLGSQYAMIALGLTLIFALMNVLNFAHGQMYVIGGFVTYTFYGQWGVPFVLALVMSVSPWHSWALDRDDFSLRLSSKDPLAKKAPCCSRLGLPSSSMR